MFMTAIFIRVKRLWESLTRQTNKTAAHEVTEAQYRGLFEQTYDAVFIIDLEGHYLQANRRATELLGYSLQELRQLKLKDVSSEFLQSQNRLSRLLAGEHIPPYEGVFHKKNGGKLTGEINAELVRDAQGKPLNWWA